MAATNLNTVRSTIEGRIKDEMETGTPPIPVVFSNVSYKPTANKSFVQCLVSFGKNEYLTMGETSGSSNKMIGAITVNIFTAKGRGSGANYTIGKRIRDLYNRIVVSGVYFDPPIGPEVVAAPTPEGFFQTRVRMTFETFEDL